MYILGRMVNRGYAHAYSCWRAGIRQSVVSPKVLSLAMANYFEFLPVSAMTCLSPARRVSTPPPMQVRLSSFGAGDLCSSVSVSTPGTRRDDRYQKHAPYRSASHALASSSTSVGSLWADGRDASSSLILDVALRIRLVSSPIGGFSKIPCFVTGGLGGASFPFDVCAEISSSRPSFSTCRRESWRGVGIILPCACSTGVSTLP